MVLGTSTGTTRTLLNELRTKGFIVRVDRGRFRVAREPNNLALARTRAAIRLRRALEGPWRIGLDGPDAVHVWTRGRYTVHAEHHALHIAVAAEDEEAYRTHLKEVGLAIGEGHRTPHVVLRVVPKPCFTVVDGTPVLDRETVLRLIHENPIAYDGADEWLVTT